MRRVLELAARIRARPESAAEVIGAFVRRWSFPLLEGDTVVFFFWDGQPADAVYLQHASSTSWR